MKYVKYVLIFFIILIIETNIVKFISIKGITPDILLIFFIFISLRESQTTATLIGFLGGLVQDLFSFGMLGLSSLTKSISCFLTSYFQRSPGKYSISYLAIVFFIITIIHDRIYQFIFSLGTNPKIFKPFFFYTVPRAIYTMTVALIINFLFNKILWQSREI